MRQVTGSALAWVRGALAVDRGAFVPLRGLRCALAVTLTLGGGIAVGQPVPGVLATVGALTAGVVSLTQGARTPYLTMAAAGTATAVSTFVGSATGHSLPAVLVALAVWGTAAGLLSAAGQAATTVGVQAVVGLLVTGRFPLSPGGAAVAAAEVLLGTAVQLLICAVLRPPVRDRPARLALAAVAEQLAAWARHPEDLGRTGGTAQALLAAQGLVRGASVGPAPAALRSILATLTRARLEISVLNGEHERSAGPQRVRLAAYLAAAGHDLDAAAAALRRGRAGTGAGDEALGPLLYPADEGGFADHRAGALAGQLRALRVALAAWADERPRAADLLHSAQPGRVGSGLRAGAAAVLHPDRAARRHAARLAVLLPATDALARLPPLPRGYWVALTAVVVLKPDFATTTRRGLGRIVGTLVGVVPATLVVGALHPRGFWLVALVGVVAWAAYTSFPAGFALFSGCLAALVVVLLDVVDPRPLSAAGARALDTLLGGGLALLAYLAFPTWENPVVPDAVGRLLAALDVYASMLLEGYAGTAPARREALGRAAQAVRAQRAAAEASIARAAGEPARTRVADLTRVRDVLTAASRVERSLHVLHAQLHEGAPGLPREPIEAFAAALHAALAAVTADLFVPGSGGPQPDLRAASGELSTGTAGQAAGVAADASRVLARAADELADAGDAMRFAVSPVGAP